MIPRISVNYILFATCRKSLNNQSAVSVFIFTATLDILPQILVNKQWRYSGICLWLFFRKCVTLILTEEDYDFGGASFVVSHTSFSSVPGCCHLHCCARINSICFHWAGSVVVTSYSLHVFYRIWFRTSGYPACVRFPACLQAYFKILTL